eukprot:7048964-Prymnesium_polylepis.1
MFGRSKSRKAVRDHFKQYYGSDGQRRFEKEARAAAQTKPSVGKLVHDQFLWGTTFTLPTTSLLSRSQAERAVFAIIGPYGLSGMDQVVEWLAAEGLTTVGLLAAADLNTLVSIGLTAGDAQRVILSAWLHTRGLEQYGPGFVQNGVVSKLLCGAHRSRPRLSKEARAPALLRTKARRAGEARPVRPNGITPARAAQAAAALRPAAGRIWHARDRPPTAAAALSAAG